MNVITIVQMGEMVPGVPPSAGMFLQDSSGRQQSEKSLKLPKKKKQLLAGYEDEWRKRKEEKKKFLIKVTSCHALWG